MRHRKLLPVAILLLGIGFAGVSTILYLNGDVKIATNNADFDVKFTKAIIDGTDVSSDKISSDGKTITFETKDLSMVNDISRLDFEITNNSVMYDVSINVECTVDDANSAYYEISKEVPTSIEGKSTGTGNVQVKLLKASVENREGTFTCTLNATATERTTKAKYTPKYFAIGTPTTASTQDYATLKYTGTETPAKLFVGLDANESQKSVCIVRNNKLECFKNNNVEEEQNHVREVFSDITCTSNGPYVDCVASDFCCNVRSDGGVNCYDVTANFHCDLNSGDTASCYS